MKHEQLVESCSAYLHSSILGEHGGVEPKTWDGPVITISRASGARGGSIAQALVNRLQNNRSLPKGRPWTLFNQNLLQHVIDEHHLPERTAEFFHEDRNPEDVRTIIGEILGLHPGAYNTLSKTAATIRRLAEAGNTVIVGRGGNFITADIERSVHVRLVGSEPFRIRHVAKRDGLTLQQAAETVHRIDLARKRYIKRVFKKDIDDPLWYDLLLNTDHFTDGEAADLILFTLLQRMG